MTQVAFGECSGFVFYTDVSSDTVRDDIPQAFIAGGPAPFTARLSATLGQCERADFQNRTVFKPFFAVMDLDVRAQNDSWNAPGRGYYTFEAVSSNADLVAAFVAGGTPFVNSNITRTTEPLAQDQVRETWTVTVGAATYTFTYSYTNETGQVLPGDNKFDRFHWFGTGPFQRLKIHHEAVHTEFVGAGPGLLTIEGDTAFGRALGRNEVPFSVQAEQKIVWIADARSETYTG